MLRFSDGQKNVAYAYEMEINLIKLILLITKPLKYLKNKSIIILLSKTVFAARINSGPGNFWRSLTKVLDKSWLKQKEICV